MTTLERQAVESFATDVKTVGPELAAATTPDRFADLLAELLELTTDCGALVVASDDTLVVKLASASFNLTIERA